MQKTCDTSCYFWILIYRTILDVIASHMLSNVVKVQHLFGFATSTTCLVFAGNDRRRVQVDERSLLVDGSAVACCWEQKFRRRVHARVVGVGACARRVAACTLSLHGKKWKKVDGHTLQILHATSMVRFASRRRVDTFLVHAHGRVWSRAWVWW